MQPAPIALSRQTQRTPDSPISTFIRLALETPNLISLAAGLVDEDSLPAAAIAEAAADVLGRPDAARAALQYGTTQGHAPLREKVLARLLDADGTRPGESGLSADDVIVTTGSQQFLYLLAELLIDPDDVVIAEAPSYFVYHGALASKGARVLTVPIDDEGMDVDALEELLGQLDRSGQIGRVKLIYVQDYFQNPTGLTLSLARRQRLVELAERYSRKHRILILEDAAYRELRYEGSDLPSLKKFDPENRHVVWTSTFSKPCAPGLKTGFGVLPRDLREPIIRLKGGHDFGSCNLAQHLLDRLMETGAYQRHVVGLQAAYRAKRDALLAALDGEFGNWPGMGWTRPAGGLYVWLRFPNRIETGPDSPLMRAALREGVLYVPGEFCHVAGPDGSVPRHEARLCFGVATADQSREAVRRLHNAAVGLEQSRPAAKAPAPAGV